MGMMNNCCYRVKVHPRQTLGERAAALLHCVMRGLRWRAATGAASRRQSVSLPPSQHPPAPLTASAPTAPGPIAGGGFGLQFEHPTIAAGTPGGWMNRVDGSSKVAAAAAVSGPPTPSSGSTQFFTMEEVSRA